MRQHLLVGTTHERGTCCEDLGQCVRDELSAIRSRLSGVHHVRDVAKEVV